MSLAFFPFFFPRPSFSEEGEIPGELLFSLSSLPFFSIQGHAWLSPEPPPVCAMRVVRRSGPFKSENRKRSTLTSEILGVFGIVDLLREPLLGSSLSLSREL